MENADRLVWIDKIKIVAAFLIVMQHCLANEWTERMAINDVQWHIINLAFIISRMGVPLFFMCSGVTMFRRKHSIKEIFLVNLPNILVPYVFWMLIYGCIDAIGSSSLRVAINAVIKPVIFGKYHTWFIATLVGLYLVTPLLQEFVYKRHLLIYFLILSCVFTVFVPYASKLGDDRLVDTLSDFNMNLVAGYVMYYLIGYFIRNLRCYRRVFIISIALFITAYCTCHWLCVYTVDDLQHDIQNYYSAFSIIGIILAVSFFIMMMSSADKQYSEGVNNVIHEWAKLGIGIYFAHPLLIPLIENLHGVLRIVGGFAVYIIVVIIIFVISVTPLKRILLSFKVKRPNN